MLASRPGWFIFFFNYFLVSPISLSSNNILVIIHDTCITFFIWTTSLPCRKKKRNSLCPYITKGESKGERCADCSDRAELLSTPSSRTPSQSWDLTLGLSHSSLPPKSSISSALLFFCFPRKIFPTFTLLLLIYVMLCSSTAQLTASTHQPFINSSPLWQPCTPAPE